MAQEVLVEAETLIEKVQAVVREYASQRRPFALVMLIPTEPESLHSRYTLIVSAPWLNKHSPREAVSTILTSLLQQLGSTEAPEYQQLTRITIIHTNDPFIRAITSAFDVTNGEVTIQNREASGIFLERAIVLEAHHPDHLSVPKVEGSQRQGGRKTPGSCEREKRYTHCHGQ
jgi:hypothetical protein